MPIAIKTFFFLLSIFESFYMLQNMDDSNAKKTLRDYDELVLFISSS